jgi:hypothetical protein
MICQFRSMPDHQITKRLEGISAKSITDIKIV